MCEFRGGSFTSTRNIAIAGRTNLLCRQRFTVTLAVRRINASNQKKAKRGVATPKQDIELGQGAAEGRGADGEGIIEMRKRKVRGMEVEMGSGNVYADLRERVDS